jgi:nickel-dependent lactate racemase
MKKKLTFTYGTETRDVEIDEDVLAAPFIEPRPSEGADKTAVEAIEEALAEPLDRPRLREMVGGKKVALVISDEFRAGLQNVITDVLLGEIAAGKPASVTVLCGTGTHDPAIYASNTEKWTMEHAKKHGLDVKFVGHDCDDPALVDVGTTPRNTKVRIEPDFLKADVRVIGHEAKHHYMAGYSSMVKSMLPGISSRETVANNHSLALDDDSKAGNYPLHPDPSRRRNPFSEDALDAFRIMNAKTVTEEGEVIDKPAEVFLLDMISDKDEVFFVKAGDPEKVTPLVIAAADKQAEFKVPKSRYVVVSPGGPPACTALYGVQNCFDMALLGAIENGGEALVYGPCNGRPGVDPEVKGLAPDGKSKALFWDNLVRMQEWPLEKCYQEIHDNFKLYLWKTWRVLRLFKRDGIKIWIHGELPADILKEGGFEHCADPQAWIDERVARGDGKFVVIDGGNKLLVTGE